MLPSVSADWEILVNFEWVRFEICLQQHLNRIRTSAEQHRSAGDVNRTKT